MLKIIRHFLGWAEIDESNVPTKNSVLVWTHTTYWDAFLMLLYKDTRRLQFVSVWNPRYFNFFTKPIFKLLKIVHAPRLEDRGLGGVQTLIRQLKEFEKPDVVTVLLISPKGTIQNKPWRTGYAHIANSLNWPVQSMLVDYEKRSIRFGKSYSVSNESTIETLTAKLQKDLENSTTLVPSRSEITVRQHDQFELLCCADVLCLSNLCMLPACYELYQRNDPLFVLSFASFIYSSLYHRSKESKFSEIDSLLAKALIVTSLIKFWPSVGIQQLSLLGISLWFLYAGQPRKFQESRGPYIVFHTLFHIFISMTAYSLITA